MKKEKFHVIDTSDGNSKGRNDVFYCKGNDIIGSVYKGDVI